MLCDATICAVMQDKAPMQALLTLLFCKAGLQSILTSTISSEVQNMNSSEHLSHYPTRKMFPLANNTMSTTKSFTSSTPSSQYHRLAMASLHGSCLKQHLCSYYSIYNMTLNIFTLQLILRTQSRPFIQYPHSLTCYSDLHNGLLPLSTE